MIILTVFGPKDFDRFKSVPERFGTISERMERLDKCVIPLCAFSLVFVSRAKDTRAVVVYGHGGLSGWYEYRRDGV